MSVGRRRGPCFLHRLAAVSIAAVLSCGGSESVAPSFGSSSASGSGGSASSSTTGAGGSPTECDEGAANGRVFAPGGSGDPTALASLAHASMPLDQGWRFKLDPSNVGEAEGWFEETFDDSSWADIEASQPWESQGYPNVDGIGWYRMRVAIPADWEAGPIRFISNGVDDEYDLYVNGEHASHFGVQPDGSVFNRTTETDVEPWIRRGEENVIAVRVNDWGQGGGLWRNVRLRATVSIDAYRELLPAPILDANPDSVALYWTAWELAWKKISFGNAQNHLAYAYMDEGFNEQIYQWDSSFIVLFGRYGSRLFPAMPTLDNFYDRQRPDGYIQRVYSETNGGEVGVPTWDEPMVNPPLFAWIEWEYFRQSGDASRLATVLPVLERYYEWLKTNATSPSLPGLYRQTDLGSGMDNTPRGDLSQGGWVDMTSQQALAAEHLSLIADAIGDADRAASWKAEYEALRGLIDERFWSEPAGMYFDRRNDAALAGVAHIGCFWPMLAGVADAGKAERLIEHLQNPAEFKRAHVFPSLAASDPAYSSSGHYWRGSVWAPTNYMTIRGLARVGAEDFAREAAENHIHNMAAVYADPPSNDASIAPEERDGDYATIWECYSPDGIAPGTRWDDTYHCRQDFVGWSGVGPIALLIEAVLGFDVIGAENKLVWRLERTDRHGIERMPLGLDNTVSLVASERADSAAPVHVRVDAQRPFVLEIRRNDREPMVRDVCAGTTEIDLP